MENSAQASSKQSIDHTGKSVSGKAATTRKSRADAVAAVEGLMECGAIKFASAMLPVATDEADDVSRQERKIVVPLPLLVASPDGLRPGSQ